MSHALFTFKSHYATHTALAVVTALITLLSSAIFMPVQAGAVYQNLPLHTGYYNGQNSSARDHWSVIPWQAYGTTSSNAWCSSADINGSYWNNTVAGNYNSQYLALPYDRTNTKAKFRDFLYQYYSEQKCNGWFREGVSFIVHTMLGHPPGSARSLSQADWNDFNSKIINNPAFTMSYNPSANPYNNSYSWTPNDANLGSPRDFSWYQGSESATEPLYTFTGPNGYTFSLKLRCANPAGNVNTNTPPTYKPGMSVNGVYGGDVIINPSERARFYAWNSVGNFGFQNPTFTGVVQRTYQRSNNTWTGWVNIHRGTYTATGNGNRLIWGQAVNLGYPIGRGTTQGGSLRSPDPIPSDMQVICYRLNITNASGAMLNPPNPTPNACARIRGGTTAPTATASPAYIEPGQSSTITASINTNSFRNWNNPASNYTVECNYVITVTPGTGPGTNNGTVNGGGSSGNCNRTISGNGSIVVVNRTFNTTTATRIGSEACIRITLTPSDFVTATNNTRTACTKVVAKPFMNIDGGDVAAGGALVSAGQCGVGDADAAIAGWPNAPAYNAAGTRYAAFANGIVTGFASAKVRTGVAQPPRALTFANTAAVSGEAYGGGYDSVPCLNDHWADKPSNLTASGGGVGAIFSNTDSGAYEFNAGVIPSGGIMIREGARKIVYVDGNLVIKGNITYQNRGGWTSVAEIPAVKFVVSGNIYIAPNVTELNGIYIAQPRSDGQPGGEIFTCANNTTAVATGTTTASGLFGTCNSGLEINGIFSAQKVHLLRTAGTASNGTAAEQFNYLPELWLANWPADTSGGGSKYDSITSLPPVL